jgi:uncharacterized protein with WD repeat
MMAATKVTPQLSGIQASSGKRLPVGMAPPTTQTDGKSKAAMKREKQKQMKQKQEEAKAREEAAAVAAVAAAATTKEQVDPEKRAKKINKILRQIEELKTKDASTWNEDQKAKVESEASLRAELAKLGL